MVIRGPLADQPELLALPGPISETDGREEVELLDERAAVLAHDDDHLTGTRRRSLVRPLRRAGALSDTRSRRRSTVVLMLPNLSICAAPRNPTSIRPGCSQ